MNQDGIKLLINLEIEKAEESLKGEKLLFDSGLYDESVSSAYYAMYHMAKALLYSINEEPITHHGLITLFGLNFVKTKLIEKEYNDMLIDAKESRESSDYDAARKFTKEEAKEKSENAQKFINRIRKYFRDNNLKLPPSLPA